MLLVLYITILNFIILFFFGRFLNNLYVGLLVVLNLFINLLVIINYYFIIYKNKITININLYNWITTNNLKVEMSIIFDNLVILMLLIVVSISLIVHIYSIEYMLYDPEQIKFLSYLSLFTFSMIILIVSNNFILFFLGWECVGITSYLLINFWYSRITANKSALMAVFINKLGDISLLISFSIIYFIIFNLDFNLFTMSILSNVLNNYWFYYISIFFIIGAVGKSAQVGLHIWLPEAMEGPTPVSSLIHAATMVTAGVFLLIKVNILFVYINNICILIIGLGSITSFMASTIGLFQYDLKKIIAYSTCSQLGYMFLANGLNGFNFSLYHLINHAFFKALLFLIAGYIIHSFNNEQDIRKLSGELEILPFAYISLLISNLSLMGFPFLSGFYSKEKIIELFLNTYNSNNVYLLNYLLFFQFISFTAVTFTIYYSVKSLVILFFVKCNNNIHTIKNIYYSSFITIYPLIILNLLSIFSGYLLQDLLIGLNNNYWFNIIFLFNNNTIYFEFIKIVNVLNILIVFYFIIIFMIININNYYEIQLINLQLNNLSLFLLKKYMFFNKNILFEIININYNLAYKYIYFLFDKGILELFGAYGMYNLINIGYIKNNNLNTGLLYHYSGLFLYYLTFLFILIIIFY
uniref:NADH-ubiquinone oxidoreductase chain 5 n=1 Tax=Acrasis kona TaxID=1008807 RepID=A0A0B4MZI0_9EUKA|nr:NADH dehydrogenase subunit 5 [Acrasis kona]AID52061.1 NADH dehydrogenase subunit 5 [Acrasis kona]